MVGRLAGRAAFITGAARGQGRSHAIRLAQEGADVLVVDICSQIPTVNYAMATPEDLAETAEMVRACGGRAVAREVDVRDRVALAAAVRSGVDELGRLDIVVANAGVCPMGPDSTVQAFVDAISVDLCGVVNTVDASLPHLGDGGSVIAIGSIASFAEGVTNNPEIGPGLAGYAWAKQSVASFIHALSLQLASRNIRANAVHPTNVNTAMLLNQEMYNSFRPDLDAPTEQDAMPAFSSQQAMPVPYVEAIDISNAVLYLASDDARYVTGLQLKVDAGSMTRQSYPAMGG